MTKYLLLFSLIALDDLSAATWRPTERLLYAVRSVESSHGVFVRGDQGQSLGEYQMSEAAWLDVSSWRTARGLRSYDYDQCVFNKKISRQYAADYLTIIYSELQKKLNRTPCSGEIYAAYNMGLGSFAECKYQLARVNPTTAKKCRQIKQIMQAKR
jgi:hypothetical protein